MRLYIGNRELDLPKNYRLARTKQVNDITSLSNRQSNFSQTIKLPKTSRNVEAFEYLGLNGDTTNIPYGLNTARLLSESGESEIEDGRIVVTKTTSSYEIVIYDGFVNFLKQIENKSLTDAGLSELNHLKNFNTVKATWDNTYPYRYLVADYNGKTLFNTDKLNIDYLIPSVRKSYLWDKVFEYAGWSYSGDVFASDDWINNFITYPKAIGDGTQVLNERVIWNFTGGVYYDDTRRIGSWWSNRLTHTPTVDDGYLQGYTTGDLPDNSHIRAISGGLYKFTFDGYLAHEDEEEHPTFKIVLETEDEDGNFQRHDIAEVNNGESVSAEDTYFYINLREDQPFEIHVYRERNDSRVLRNQRVSGDMDISASYVEGDAVDFEEALINFEMKDFIEEILWEFALTPFVDAKNKTIEFLTVDEWLRTNTRKVDWSSDKRKFIRKTGERYIFGNYGQLNFFRHKYNESDADYNDGSISIANSNLPDKKDVVRSRVYTVENEKTTLVSPLDELNIYKFWEKNVNDDGTVKYKELQNRYYFQREELMSTTGEGALQIGSEKTAFESTVETWYKSKHTNFNWSDIIANRYDALHTILNTQRIVTVEVYMNDIDFREIDFRNLYFIKELGSYFIINKVPNYIKAGTQKVELLEVDLDVTDASEEVADPLYITLESEYVYDDPNHEIRNIVTFNYEPADLRVIARQYSDSPINGGTYTGLSYSTDILTPDTGDGVVFDLGTGIETTGGWYLCEVEDNDTGLKSNEVLIYVGDIDNDDIGVQSIELDVFNSSIFLPGIATIAYQYKNWSTPPTESRLHYARLNAMGEQISSFASRPLSLTPINTVISESFDFGEVGYFRVQIRTNDIDSAYQDILII